MARKRWTPQTELSDSLLKFRAKRKWQLSYRRYVIEKMPSEAYAPYFGLDIETLRKWFELQFTEGLSWENHGKAWQFDHIIPTTYFDYAIEEDLALCWNFINIRVGKLDENNSGTNRIDLLAVKPHFQSLYEKTGYVFCTKMLDKIGRIEAEASESRNFEPIERFLIQNKTLLENIGSFNKEEFNRLNRGSSAEELLLEREILRKFG
ncbi:MAG: hypothetical protein RLZZ28_400 [Bacteroidota bacterium]|jgi:hypothetical protein